MRPVRISRLRSDNFVQWIFVVLWVLGRSYRGLERSRRYLTSFTQTLWPGLNRLFEDSPDHGCHLGIRELIRSAYECRGEADGKIFWGHSVCCFEIGDGG